MTKLLSINADAKTIKGNKKGYLTAIQAVRVCQQARSEAKFDRPAPQLCQKRSKCGSRK